MAARLRKMCREAAREFADAEPTDIPVIDCDGGVLLHPVKRAARAGLT